MLNTFLMFCDRFMCVATYFLTFDTIFFQYIVLLLDYSFNWVILQYYFNSFNCQLAY